MTTNVSQFDLHNDAKSINIEGFICPIAINPISSTPGAPPTSKSYDISNSPITPDLTPESPCPHQSQIASTHESTRLHRSKIEATPQSPCFYPSQIASTPEYPTINRHEQISSTSTSHDLSLNNAQQNLNSDTPPSAPITVNSIITKAKSLSVSDVSPSKPDDTIIAQTTFS